jgi:hypothetical protein
VPSLLKIAEAACARAPPMSPHEQLGMLTHLEDMAWRGRGGSVSNSTTRSYSSLSIPAGSSFDSSALISNGSLGGIGGIVPPSSAGGGMEATAPDRVLIMRLKCIVMQAEEDRVTREAASKRLAMAPETVRDRFPAKTTSVQPISAFTFCSFLLMFRGVYASVVARRGVLDSE